MHAIENIKTELYFNISCIKLFLKYIFNGTIKYMRTIIIDNNNKHLNLPEGI